MKSSTRYQFDLTRIPTTVNLQATRTAYALTQSATCQWQLSYQQ